MTHPYRSPAELAAPAPAASPSWWARLRHRRHMAQERAAVATMGRWTPVVCDCRICSRWTTPEARLLVRVRRALFAIVSLGSYRPNELAEITRTRRREAREYMRRLEVYQREIEKHRADVEKIYAEQGIELRQGWAGAMPEELPEEQEDRVRASRRRA